MPDPVVLTVGGATLEISEKWYGQLRFYLAGEFWLPDKGVNYAQACALADTCLHAPGLLARLVEWRESRGVSVEPLGSEFVEITDAARELIGPGGTK